jgi:hypothetical protein
MTPDERLKASIDFTLHYFKSYYVEWRLVKVLTNQKLLKERYDFLMDISNQVCRLKNDNGETYIAQEIRNGLYFDTIAHCVQYIEDLFALIKAAKKPDYFIRNVITYSAGEVTNAIKSFHANKKTLSNAFHFPNDFKLDNDSEQKEYDDAVDSFVLMVNDLVKFYIDYAFFYNQYKHGLAVGMKPFGNTYNSEQIQKDKNGEFKPYLVVYDNLNIETAAKKGTFNLKHGVMMPGLTANILPFLPELAKSNNFLRFVFPPDYPNFSFDLLLDVAFKTRSCINAFIDNYSHEICKIKKITIPINHRTDTYIHKSY